MLVALTGATGFVGSHTVQSLIDAGHQVRALIRPGRGAGWLEGLGVEVCRGALGDETALCALVASVDAVVHTAYDSAVWDAQDQLPHLRSNVLGSLMLLELARQAGVRQFICTVSTYLLRRDVEGPGDVREAPLDETAPWVASWMPYVTHNVILESASQAYGAQFGMATTRFRCAWIYGVHPQAEKSVWRSLLEDVRAGRVCDNAFGCDVVAVQDVAAALTASVGRPAAFGQVFNLCDMFVYQTDLARLAGEAVGIPAKVSRGDLPRPGPIRSEKVRALGLDVHRGPDGIRAYFGELDRALKGQGHRRVLCGKIL